MLFGTFQVYSQDSLPRKGYWSTSLAYTYDFYVKGFVYVKEIHSSADSISFKEDLKVSRWHNLALNIKRTFRNDASLSLSMERFLFTGVHRQPKNLHYNQLVINGNAGISIKDSKIFRALALYEAPLTKRGPALRAYYAAGLLYDYIHFKINGQIVNEGDSLNFKEDFNDQIIPAPVLGAKLEWAIGSADRSLITLQGMGTYVSDWLKIYHYEYTAWNVSLGYRYNTRCFFVSPKIIGRHLHSREDERHHVFDISTVGANLELGFKF